MLTRMPNGLDRDAHSSLLSKRLKAVRDDCCPILEGSVSITFAAACGSKIQGLGFRVWGVGTPGYEPTVSITFAAACGLTVQGLGYHVCCRLRVYGLHFKIQGLRFGVWGEGSVSITLAAACGFTLQDSGFGV